MKATTRRKYILDFISEFLMNLFIYWSSGFIIVRLITKNVNELSNIVCMYEYNTLRLK